MKRRIIFTLVAVAFFLGAIAFIKVRQIQTAIAQGSAWQPPPEAVTTIVASEDQWPETLGSIGSVEAVHGVTVSADLPGTIARINFDSGRSVRAGDVLVVLDTSQEKAQRAAAEAQRELAQVSFQRMRTLHDNGAASQAELDNASADLKQAEARVGEIDATIQRKTIRAPFTGTLGIRQVNLGQYLQGGAPIVPLQSLDPIYVDFSVPQQEVAALHVGREVLVTVEGNDQTPGFQQRGRLTAVNSVIDTETRNIQVQATLENREGKLRPGMFVRAQVVLGPGTPAVVLPTSAVNFAPYGDSVFIVENMKAPTGQEYMGVRQQFVKLGPQRGDQVAVLDGVPAGAVVVTSGVFKLRNGAAVQVNNTVQPTNNPAPRPEDS